MTSTAISATAMEELMQQIHAVTDPELDKPVTDFGCIESIDIGANDHVRIVFRPPT